MIVGSKAYSFKTKTKYLGETLTNDLEIYQHLREKKAIIQSILHVCIYTENIK